MKVSELMELLREMPKDAVVYVCKDRDWRRHDEDNNITDIYRLEAVWEQVVKENDGMDFTDIHEVILGISDTRAADDINWDDIEWDDELETYIMR